MIQGLLSRLTKAPRNPARLEDHAKGVIHVGAHKGQERDEYAARNLPVLWVEPNPDLFPILEKNLEGYPDQIAVQALAGEHPGHEVEFHIAHNHGASSSILPPKDHSDLHPEVGFAPPITMTTHTLPEIIERAGQDPTRFDSIVLDTQGSELMILRGAIEILPNINWIKSEVADFEAYEGCAQRQDMITQLRAWGFALVSDTRIARRKGVGAYYDLTFRRS